MLKDDGVGDCVDVEVISKSEVDREKERESVCRCPNRCWPALNQTQTVPG